MEGPFAAPASALKPPEYVVAFFLSILAAYGLMLGIKDMNSLCIFTVLAGILLASSCHKHEALSKEHAGLEAELNQGNNEAQTLDAQIASLPPHNVSPEQQHSYWLGRNTELERALADLSKKCNQGDELLKKVRTKLDAYNALID